MWATIPKQYKDFVDTWVIHIFPSHQAKEDPNFHGQEGVGGVTGMNNIRLYIEDTRTLREDLFQRVLRKNAVPITHELCHAILIHLKKTHKVPLRNDDYSGHKAGTKLNFSTAEVHDRHSENNFWTMRFWFWDWHDFTLMRCRVKALEIRDLI